MNLENLRQSIDEINTQIIELFGKRLNIVLEIARIKKQDGLAIFDPKREKEQLQKICEKAKQHGINPAIIEEIFTLFVQYSKLKEWEIVDESKG